MGFYGVFMAPTCPRQTQGKRCKIKRFYSTPVGIKKTTAEGSCLAQIDTQVRVREDGSAGRTR